MTDTNCNQTKPAGARKFIGWTVLSLLLVTATLLAGNLLVRELRMLIYQTVEAAVARAGSDVVQRCLWEDARSHANERLRIATRDTVNFIRRDMQDVPELSNRLDLIEHSLQAVDPQLTGLYCEFGVFEGASINHIASKTPNIIHGFDSFEGIPEDWSTLKKGAFRIDGLPEVEDNVRLHKGWFENSLPVWAEQHAGAIVFANFDADLYSSTKTIFDILGDRFVEGSIIHFDEYFNYPHWQKDGEYRAFMEFVEQRNVEFEYVGYSNMAVAVRIKSIDPVGVQQPVVPTGQQSHEDDVVQLQD